MAGIAALCILLAIYAASELMAQKTKAIFSTVLGVAILLLIGFWSGILPKTLFEDAGIDKFGNIAAGLLLVSLGTTIDFAELKRQWKVLVTALACVLGAVACIIAAGMALGMRDAAIAGAPIFAGGSAATLIVVTALKEKGLEAITTFCLSLYIMQKFIGVPVASAFLRRAAKRFRSDPALVAEYAAPIASGAAVAEKPRGPLALPASWGKPSVYLTKLALTAVAAKALSDLTGGAVHYFVLCLVVGVVLFGLGFLEKGILAKTEAGGLITFLVTIIIFSNLSDTTPAQVLSAWKPLLLTSLCGVAGILLVAFLCGKALKLDFGLAVSLGISCTFGFPTTMLMPKEVAQAIGQTEEERTAIENYLLPKMLTAGLVTVTIASVLIAGVAINLL